MRRRAAVALDKRQGAALHLVGAIDGEIELGLAGEVGDRDAERLSLAMRLDGRRDADDAETVTDATSDLFDNQR
jgi:hypothetical protein